MNDFSELECELKKLRPAQPSAELISRIEGALVHARDESDNIIQPESRQSVSEFRIAWLGIGLAAAAAIFLIFTRIDSGPSEKRKTGPAAGTFTSATPGLQQRVPNYQPAGLTQVVYGRHDDGLVFPRGAAVPARRIWTGKRETLRWRDRETGAQLAVSYPAEEVTLIPVSGQ